MRRSISTKSLVQPLKARIFTAHGPYVPTVPIYSYSTHSCRGKEMSTKKITLQKLKLLPGCPSWKQASVGPLYAAWYADLTTGGSRKRRKRTASGPNKKHLSLQREKQRPP